MKLTVKQKQHIIAEIRLRKDNYDSQSKMATAMGISSAQMARILKGEYDKVLSDDNFLAIANELGLDMKGYGWKTAKTPTFNMIYTQLEACRQDSISAMLVDEAGVGKTHAAREYVKSHANAVYIDCSQVKTKQLLVRDISKKFGLSHTGRYEDVYRNLVFFLNTSLNPLIIIDEAGDLAYPAFLELKAIWNASESSCGWYMMGADGLKAKIDRNINSQKVGYTEIFRRFGERYQQISPVGKEESDEFRKQQLAAVATANNMTNIRELYAKTAGSLTRLKIEFLKMKRKALTV